MNYVMDRQVNLKKIEDQKANYLSTEFETTQGKISNLHNTYVSFQRTFEHKNKTDAMLNLVTNYEILRQITAPTRYEKAIKQLSKSYLMTQLISHPQQKLLSKKGGLSIIYKDIAEPELLKQSQNYDFSFQNYAIIWQILALTEELCSWTITQIQSQNTPRAKTREQISA